MPSRIRVEHFRAFDLKYVGLFPIKRYGAEKLYVIKNRKLVKIDESRGRGLDSVKHV